MADEKTNIKGHTGILSMGGLPIVCLTSTSSSLVAETVENIVSNLQLQKGVV